MPTFRYLKEALSNISQGILILDQEHRILFANKPFQVMMDVPDELISEGHSVHGLLKYLADRGEFGSGDVEEKLRHVQSGFLSQAPYRDERLRPDGRYIIAAGNPFDDGGYVYTFTDVTERHREKERLAAEVEEKTLELRKANRELSHLASLDPLLDIPNRRRFSAIADVIAKQMTQQKASSTVMMLDIDHFKSINDTHGHAAGDSVLMEVVARIRVLLKSGDHLARYGGEEFVVLLPMKALTDGLTVAEAIRNAITTSPIVAVDTALSVTVSIGLSEWHPSEANIEEALTRADTALYDAKREGRNRSRFVARRDA